MIRQVVRSVRVLAGAVRSPSDAMLLMAIGTFIVRLPVKVRRTDVPTFLRRMETAPRPKAVSLESGYDRIARLRNACLSMPRLWQRNTCYIRALTLYRFLDPGEKQVRFHVGVEQPLTRAERLRGHAWVSVDGHLFEAPDALYERRVNEVPLDRAT